MAEETVETQKQPSNKNPMMMILIILLVVLLLAVGGLGYLIYSKGLLNDKEVKAPQNTTEQPVQPEQQATNGESFKASIDSLVLNITDAKGRAKLMKLSFTLKTKEPLIEAVIEDSKAEIIDAVIRAVSVRSAEELLTVGGKAMLKEELIDDINNILNDSIREGDEDRVRSPIMDIFFTSFVIK